MGTISDSGHTMSHNDTPVLPMSSRCWSADRTTTNPNILKKGEYHNGKRIYGEKEENRGSGGT